LNDDGTIEENQEKFRFISEETSSKFPRTILKENDIVFTVRGTMGKIGIIPKKLEGSNITANLMRISPNRKIVSPEFFEICFSFKILSR